MGRELWQTPSDLRAGCFGVFCRLPALRYDSPIHLWRVVSGWGGGCDTAVYINSTCNCSQYCASTLAGRCVVSTKRREHAAMVLGRCVRRRVLTVAVRRPAAAILLSHHSSTLERGAFRCWRSPRDTHYVYHHKTYTVYSVCISGSIADRGACGLRVRVVLSAILFQRRRILDITCVNGV